MSTSAKRPAKLRGKSKKRNRLPCPGDTARVEIFGTVYELREHPGIIEDQGLRCMGQCKPLWQRLLISSAVPRGQRDTVIMKLVMQAARYELGRRAKWWGDEIIERLDADAATGKGGVA